MKKCPTIFQNVGVAVLGC